MMKNLTKLYPLRSIVIGKQHFKTVVTSHELDFEVIIGYRLYSFILGQVSSQFCIS